MDSLEESAKVTRLGGSSKTKQNKKTGPCTQNANKSEYVQVSPISPVSLSLSFIRAHL